MQAIIVSPSLDTSLNVSGISAVTQFIIDNNPEVEYIHFEQGKRDKDSWGSARFFGLINNIKSWKNLLNEYPEAVVHFNYPLMLFSIVRDYIFMNIAHKMGRKLVVHIHGGTYLMKDKVPALQKWCLKKVFSRNVAFVVLSDLEKKRIEEIYGAKNVTVLPNCVDLHDAEAFERVEKQDGETLTFGYIGRFAKNKGFLYMLDAFKQLKAEGVPFKLRLAGMEERQGEFIDTFKDALGDQFECVGLVSGVTKNAFLRSLDVFVLPSFFEGLPMSLLECMSYGVVPVTTPVGSIPSVLKDGKNGLFIKVKDKESLVRKIKFLHSNRDKLKLMGESAKKIIYDQFSPKIYVEKLNKLYKDTE